jgi:hypothetical protein
MPFQRCSPDPSKTGLMAICSSSIKAARKILPNSGYAATEANVAAARCCLRLLQSSVNAFSDKAELCASRHSEQRPRLMRQYEDRRVIRRLVAPPTFPAIVRPWTTDRTKHVALRIQAPIPAKLCSATSLSTPASPSSWPCIFRHTRVWKNHSINSSPLMPSEFWRSWLGPAP